MRNRPASEAKARSDGRADFDGVRGDHNRPSDGMKPKRKIDRLKYVVKLSKYCNLRCSYCYEFEDLHKKDRMDLGQIQKMFLNIRAHAVEYSVKAVEFIWHGGEPLLFKPSFFREISRLQASIFGADVVVTNTVQTNLTILSRDMLSFLAERGFFDSIGVSFDPYQSQRVDTRGKPSVETVSKNMQTLIDQRIPFGVITVITRGNLDSVGRTFDFFDAHNIAHRFLPYYMSANLEQEQKHAVTYDEILLSYMQIVDAWFVSANAPQSYPMEEYMAYAQRSVSGAVPEYFDYEQEESAFIVDVDGGTWGVMGAYEPHEKYGCLFHQDFTEILAADRRQVLKAEIQRRTEAHCGSCEYHGACPGKYIAQSTRAERELIDIRGCIVKDVIAHILLRCEQTGLMLAFAQAGPSPGLAVQPFDLQSASQRSDR
jgi:uncharacterized protein